MKLSEIKQILAAGGIQLTKSLGQNFLHDGNQLRRIVEAAELTKTDRVLEIGPGLGPLTELLLDRAGEVLAIEKDARFVELLRERLHATQPSSLFPSSKQLETVGMPILRLLHADALAFLRREPRDWSDWKLVANLPYSVASPILVELAQAAKGPRRIVVTLQWEVARRLVAKVQDDDYGLLSLLVQLRYEPQGLFKIPAGCFFPEPEVDSACVRLVRRAKSLLPENQTETFNQIIRRGFSQRRKMMLKLLKEDWPGHQLEKAFESLALSPQVRAEAVSVEQFVELTKRLSG
ncbi:MAG TPA: 16S rRNA (adenine(1518)-N(6)/adenine(1519)-N(6))-dimethyltransferase RsmA [Candidatus Eisenbacteria bacterium]|jgi:16S rRNA (adenine1518-N6/adenine1519-N6)-dimethyltransferase|nr:16S rRNA (adenine(1518)-N(6)/adenine(1519)-N(6))-dimethyltransferase RsmA [Candidatus Eisenbacteria bacterium]